MGVYFTDPDPLYGPFGWGGGTTTPIHAASFSTRRSMSTLCLRFGGVHGDNYVNNIALFLGVSLLYQELSLLQIVDQQRCCDFFYFEFVCFASLCPKLHQESLLSTNIFLTYWILLFGCK